MIANTIIKAVFRRLFVRDGTFTPSTQQYADGLEALNDLINSWSADGNLVYEDSMEEITIASGTQSFTIGASGDEVSGRPLEIRTAVLKDANNGEYPLRSADATMYANFFDKTITTRPRRYYYRNTFPNGTFSFNAKTDLAYTLILTSLKELTNFPDGTTSIDLPAYYEKAFKDNLFIELATEAGAGKRVTPLHVARAEQSKNTIIGRAVKLQESVTELSRGGIYNIEADTY